MSASNPIQQYASALTRRHFFGQSAFGLGAAALGSLLPSSILTPGVALGNSVAAGGMPDLPHFAPRAKRAIYLHMNGGPSQMDLFDYKPKMADMFDVDLPESIRKGQRLTTMTSGQTRFPPRAVEVQVPAVWPAGGVDQRVASLHGPHGR